AAAPASLPPVAPAPPPARVRHHRHRYPRHKAAAPNPPAVMEGRRSAPMQERLAEAVLPAPEPVHRIARWRERPPLPAARRPQAALAAYSVESRQAVLPPPAPKKSPARASHPLHRVAASPYRSRAHPGRRLNPDAWMDRLP
ncbi:MAG TPA: hypothetical protein VKT32_03435, partial [Chthonomonadaceae bacterium]|nr:hypothetical protein [Chthonomonadaceae bacterium]